MIIYLSFFFCTLIAGEVIFDQAQPDFPPDFIFGPQDVEFIPNIGEIKVSTVGDIDVPYIYDEIHEFHVLEFCRWKGLCICSSQFFSATKAVAIITKKFRSEWGFEP